MKLFLYTLIALFIFSSAAFAQAQLESEKGIELYQQGEYEKAVEILQASVKANDEDRQAWLFLGASYVNLKNEKEASKAFRKAKDFSAKDLSGYDPKLEIILKPHARYTEDARSNRISGTVKIAVEFKADGEIGFIFPVQRLHFGLTENVVNAAKGIKFEPAIKNGKPVTVVSIIAYIFTIY